MHGGQVGGHGGYSTFGVTIKLAEKWRNPAGPIGRPFVPIGGSAIGRLLMNEVTSIGGTKQ
jgi:hypothetical protein